MTDTAKLVLGENSYELPVVTGSEGEKAIDIRTLLARTGHMTLDEGYRSTGSCSSTITFIDGDAGILRYRGIPIQQLAEQSTFVETAMLVIFGQLPSKAELEEFRQMLREEQTLDEGLIRMFDGFPRSSPPMAILSSMINGASCYHPDLLDEYDPKTFKRLAARLLSKVRTIAAATYRVSRGKPIVHPHPAFNYCMNFLHMMFSDPYRVYEAPDSVRIALRQVLILHADHEQNCSTSTVRMVASSGTNLFTSCAAGVCALWGWRHGGANVAVIEMLQDIQKSGVSVDDYVEKVKRKEVKLMGFGHRVYKSYDPRAKYLAQSMDRLMAELKFNDPLINIARQLEERALSDSYFKDRDLYPNVDFYSGIILRAIGFPLEMFTVMFSIGRMPGWIANWKEVRDSFDGGIYRPRQLYQGPTAHDYTPLDQR